ncbi:MAG: ABC transporter ATP-binding protein [Actinomycetota bacterium]|nr:ABC transporter ATP-binding protein [Actinomycetota bacterium]MCL6092308.1 ABC transporter ATP-binding protein [Actinomycetota bacterium]MDA8166984.1 ABC transporter ATP-binding protein [Actinomycetota bacterium]
MRAAIEIEGLTKTYGAGSGSVTPVDGLSLTVASGEIFGLLGPNGAGKTTTIKMLAGLVFPSSGSASLLGNPVGHVQTRVRIGYLPESISMNTFMRAAEYLDFHARLYGMGAARRRQKVADVLEQTGLKESAESRVRNFSRGMMQRMALAQAIINEPELLLLDEPASALDPIGRRDLRDIIIRMRNRGTTVLINSHLLSEVEMICTRIGIMNRGRLIRIGEMGAIIRPVQVVDVKTDGLSAEAMASIEELAAKVDFLAGGSFTAMLGNDEEIARLVEIITTSGAVLRELSPRNMTLEAAFLEEIAAAERS